MLSNIKLPTKINDITFPSILTFEEAEEVVDKDWNYGCSKLVFKPPNASYVIKTPLTGYYSDDKEYIYSDFTGAKGSKPNDYCNAELELYQSIKETHSDILCFFAETAYIGCNKQGKPFYAQEKVIPAFYYEDDDNEELLLRPSEASKVFVADRIRHNDKDYNNFDAQWLALALDYYGDQKLKNLFNYLASNKDLSNDLHTQNYGYRVSDGSPCILDFSGFNY